MTDRSWLKWLIAGLILYVCFVLIRPPATWAIRSVEKANLPVAFSNATGSIWNGSAAVAIQLPRSATVEPGNIRWRVNPLYLITGRIGIKTELKTNRIRVSTVGRVGTNTILFDNLDATLPVEVVTMFFPIAANAGLTGNIHVTTGSFSLQNNLILGTAEIQLDALSSTWLGPASTGSYKINVEADGKVMHGVVTTRSGVIQLEGTGTWEPFSGGRLVFEGNVSGNSGTPLRAALQNLGKANSDGSIHVLWNAHLAYPLASFQAH